MSKDLITIDPPRPIALKMEHRIQHRRRTIEIDEADAQVLHRGVGAEGADGVDDEGFEGLDEGPVVDARAVVVGVQVAADVVDHYIDGFEPRAALAGFLCRFDGCGEERAADTAGVG